jgi:hypothetical protein
MTKANGPPGPQCRKGLRTDKSVLFQNNECSFQQVTGQAWSLVKTLGDSRYVCGRDIFSQPGR